MRPFENFLHASFSKYCDRQVFSFNLSFVDKEDCEARSLSKATEKASVVDVESEDEDEEGMDEARGRVSEYAQRRAENIAENKLILKKLFPNSENSLLKGKKKSVSGQNGLEKDPQRASQKHEKHWQSLINGYFSTSSGSANNNDQPPEISESESPSISLHDTSNVREDSLSVGENTHSPSLDDLNDTSSSVNLHDADPCNVHEDSPKDMDVVDSTVDGIDSDMADTATNSIPPDVALAKETQALEKDDSLPPWLVQTIGYLRGVSEDQAWQDLVTEFVQFEKSGPPIGVMFDSHIGSLLNSD